MATAAAASAESAFTRELSFSLEEPRDARRGRKLAIAAAVLAIVSTTGYASWSWDVRDESSLIGPPPAGPVPDLGLEATPGVPPAEVMDQIFQPGFIGLQPAPAAIPAPVPSAAPPPAATAPAPGGDPVSTPVQEQQPVEPAPAPQPTFPRN